MKYIFILADGMADRPNEVFGGKTFAKTGAEQTFKKLVACVRIEFHAPFRQILNEYRSG